MNIKLSVTDRRLAQAKRLQLAAGGVAVDTTKPVYQSTGPCAQKRVELGHATSGSVTFQDQQPVGKAAAGVRHQSAARKSVRRPDRESVQPGSIGLNATRPEPHGETPPRGHGNQRSHRP